MPIANLAYCHLNVVGPEPPADDKLLSWEVLVPNVKAAEDLNLWPGYQHAAPYASSAAELDFQAFRWMQAAQNEQFEASLRGKSPSESLPVWAERILKLDVL